VIELEKTVKIFGDICKISQLSAKRQDSRGHPAVALIVLVKRDGMREHYAI
jgi:hypothetical protein